MFSLHGILHDIFRKLQQIRELNYENCAREVCLLGSNSTIVLPIFQRPFHYITFFTPYLPKGASLTFIYFKQQVQKYLMCISILKLSGTLPQKSSIQ